MSSDINVVVIAGRLTRDPELKAVGSTVVCALGVANNYSVKDQTTGEWNDRPNFFDVQVWGARGETVARYLEKGRQVLVRGRLRWRQWEAQDGTKRSAVSIEADEVQFIGPREGGQQPAAPQQTSASEFQKRAAETLDAQPIEDDDIPFLRAWAA